MILDAPLSPYAEAVIAAGDRWLAAIGPALDAADPEGRVGAQSRLLCAGLGVLGVAAYRALGGSRRADEVGRAGALLSLLTKVDDQVIDARAFHADRADVVQRTRAFLAPTLASLRDARAVNDEPRCAFAAELGRLLRDLAGHDGGDLQTPGPAGDDARLDRVLATIAAGWEIQVEAVRVLTAHPSAVTRVEVAAVTRSISGLWLLMIARLGELPADARRAFTAAEEDAFLAWGWAIQRADALADLAKDLADGHLSTWPGVLLWERAPDAYLDAAARGDTAALHALLATHGIDRACLPDAAERAALAASLPDLGEVPALLAFIHDYLLRRHRAHPLHPGEPGAIAVPPAIARLFPTSEAACSAP